MVRAKGCPTATAVARTRRGHPRGKMVWACAHCTAHIESDLALVCQVFQMARSPPSFPRVKKTLVKAGQSVGVGLGLVGTQALRFKGGAPSADHTATSRWMVIPNHTNLATRRWVYVPNHTDMTLLPLGGWLCLATLTLLPLGEWLYLTTLTLLPLGG